MASWTSFVHVVATIALFKISSCKSETLLFSAALLPICGFGITVGAHRLWSHRSFSAGLPLRILLMFCNSIANQSCIFHWVRDHRVHHKHSETSADPHNATRGFFFAHIGWLLLKKHPDVKMAGKQMDMSDLMRDPVIRFQRKLDPFFAQFMCFYIPAKICTLWGEDFWNGILVAGGLRYVYCLHCTFLVNSAAHLYGDHPYDASISPAENPIVSALTFGEGWHNWHHMYPFDYAASEFGISSQSNPSKLFIDLMAVLGQVRNRKRATDAWALRRAKRDKITNETTAVDLKEEQKMLHQKRALNNNLPQSYH